MLTNGVAKERGFGNLRGCECVVRHYISRNTQHVFNPKEPEVNVFCQELEVRATITVQFVSLFAKEILQSSGECILP